MSERPYVLSIAGFDPSAGAGLLADIKTFEQHKVYGLGICTGNTLQTDTEFFSIDWMKEDDILYQLQILLKRFSIAACKIGIIPSFGFLSRLVEVLRSFNSKMFIVFDPVLSATAGFEFHCLDDSGSFSDCFMGINLITPNYDELKLLTPSMQLDNILEHTSILLKGGHNREKIGTDILYHDGEVHEIIPFCKEVFDKHGSGCILSAAIAANMSLGNTLLESCTIAKDYTEKKLNSNSSLLAYHHI
jgi:hydroxymethylpyrimidine/phosphomethylpyrimidine kinase